MSRRVVIAGIDTGLGGRVAAALAAEPDIDVIRGVRVTELDGLAGALREVAADTLVDARLPRDPGSDGAQAATEAVVAASQQADVGCLVVVSCAHAYGCAPGDPAYFTEEMVPARGGTAHEQGVRAAERHLASLRGAGARVAVLRLVDVLGDQPSGLDGLLGTPGVVPCVLGYDPRLQVLHPEDAVSAIEHAVLAGLDGTFNVAADGVLALSELTALLGRRAAPVVPPWGARLAAAPLRRFGVPAGPELLALLRHGRAVDNRRLKATGLRLRYTTREAALAWRGRVLAPVEDDGTDG